MRKLPVYSKPKVIHVINVFFASIEFSPLGVKVRSCEHCKISFVYLVDVFSAGGAAHVARCHHTDDEGSISVPLHFRDLRRVKVRGIVLVQHLSLRHCEASCIRF